MAQAKQSKKKQKNAGLTGEIAGILLIAFGVLLGIFIYFSNKAPLAELSRTAVFGLFGAGGYLLPPFVCALGIFYIFNINLKRSTMLMAGLFFWFLLAFIELCTSRVFSANAVSYFPYLSQCFSSGKNFSGGGIFGGILSYPAEWLMGKTGGLILLGALMLVTAMLITHFSIRGAACTLGSKIKGASMAARREREQKKNYSIKESAKDVDSLYEENFREDDYTYRREIQEHRMQQRIRENEEHEQQDEKPAAEPELKKQQEPLHLARQAAKRKTDELNLLNHEFSQDEVFPAADESEQKRIQLYFSDAPKGSYFKHAGKLRPKRGLKRKANTNNLIVSPKVKDPVQQKLAEQYYEDAQHTSQKFSVSAASQTASSSPQDRYFFAEEDIKTENPIQEISPEAEQQEQTNHKQPQEERPQQTKQMPEIPPAVAQQAPQQESRYLLPERMDLLDEPIKSDYGKRMEKENLSKALILEQALKSFNIDIKVNNIVTGPTVTRYELLPAPGVKVSRILSLSNDIALNLAVPSVRIEAPIPGKAAIGIEVPNREVSMVKIKELLDTDEFRKHKSRLYFALGKDIAGKNIYGDLAKMPHLLVAGTTGSGKSVCINSIIMSILYRSSPEEVNLLMVDPKVVEMKRFNGIPHMKTAVVTDPKKATSMLNWVVNEMLKRYKDFANANVKEIDTYNQWLQQNHQKIMPKLVVVIDELADLMMASKHEVEDAICRIAQLGRAAGIHLVVATQTPRADVITGMIKTNISSRIALTVSSGLDSRIILDMNGAEDLLGNGDMLFMPIGQSKPIRVQGCYISDAENDRVIEFLKTSATQVQCDEELEKQLDEGVEQQTGAAGGEEAASADGFDDELIPKAIELALEYEQLSSSMLMRRLKIGYARAARLVDQLELKEIVSSADGNKPRQVLITQEDYRRMFGKEDK